MIPRETNLTGKGTVYIQFLGKQNSLEGENSRELTDRSVGRVRLQRRHARLS